MDVLLDYAWPGNIRELKNVIERAVVVCAGASIDREHLPPELLSRPAAGPAARASYGHDSVTLPPPGAPLRNELDALERRRILDALERSAGHQGRAAEILGISRRTLLSRLDAHGLPRPRKGREPPKR
jgi:DNA-binding NtrC family response regulator